MASNLLNTGYGADALREAVCDQIRRRIRRWFKRNTVIAFDDWVAGNKLAAFDFATVLGNLNVGHDQEIYDLYQLLKELENGYGSINGDFYVDTVAGDDELGDGSVDAPFATMNRVIRLLPKYIDSAINIFLTAPTATPVLYMDNLNIEFGTGGQLTIQGRSNPNVLVSTGWADIGVGDTYAHALTVAGAGWPVNNWQGAFVHVTSGANAGAYYAIARNTADTIIVPVTPFPMAPGDSFSILEPGDFIKLDFQQWRGKFSAKNFDGSSRFIMSNIHFLSLASEFSGNESIDIWLPLVYIDNLVTSGGYVGVNRYDPYDIAQIGNPEFRDENPFTYCLYSEFSSLKDYFYNGVSEGLSNIVGHLEIEHSIWQNYQSYNGSSNKVDNCYCFNVGGDTLELFDFSTLRLDGLWVENATNAVDIETASSARVANLEGTPANITGYTVVMGGLAGFQFSGTPVSGTTNDVNWNIIAAAAAFPVVAGTGISDLIGAWVIKLS